MIHRCSGGAPEHNASCVVGAIDESAAGSLDVFDAGVVGFYFSRGGAGDDENFDLFPPSADGPPEPGRLGLIGFPHQPLKCFLRQLGVLQGAGTQQSSHLFFHIPSRLEFPGWIVGREDLL